MPDGATNKDQETLRVLAERAGFELSQEQVEKMAAGLQRNRDGAEGLRKIIRPEVEPAPVFNAGEGR